MQKRITTPLTDNIVNDLRCGDSVLLSGVIYTARDAAHKRLCELLRQGKDLPFETEGSVIYFVGPTPAKPGQVLGSAGPTTSYRMDSYSPSLIEKGLKGMIGKGKRNREVIQSMKEHNAVYFGAIGGCGALLSKCIEKSEVIAYEDLGSEAIRKLYVKDFPVFVIIDSQGNNLYEQGRRDYLESLKDKQ